MKQKNKNYRSSSLTFEKGKNVRALPLCLSLPIYLSSLMMTFVCVVCCVRALFREKRERREMRAVSSCQRLCSSPCSILPAWALCVLAFLDRLSICGSKGVCVLRELRRVNLYTAPDAVLSFRRVFIVFLFSAVVQ